MEKYRKKVIWTLAVMLLCLSDQQIGSMGGEWQGVYRNLSVAAVGLIALGNYPFKSFQKRFYYILAALSVTVGSTVILLFIGKVYYPRRLVVITLLAVIYTFLVVRTVEALVLEKKRPSVHWGILVLYGLYFFLACLSRYHDNWNRLYLGCYGLVLLTAFSKKDLDILKDAVIDGIIAGFFFIQGIALIHRPYDTLRYLGMYSNTNMNALLYQMAYCAFLSRFCLLEAEGKVCERRYLRLKTIQKWFCFLMACAMWSFVLLTMCRSAMLSMGAATAVAGIWLLWRRRSKPILMGLRYIALLCLCSVCCFPLVYGAVRYLPAVFDEPWYFFEGDSEERVHEWDPWDSPKFTDWKDVLRENFGRIVDLIPGIAVNSDGKLSAEATGENLWQEGLLLCSNGTAGMQDAGQVEQKSTSIRKVIYTYYFHSLNLEGHLESENGLQVTEDYYAPHAHDLFLQIAFNYGIITGVIFLCYILLTLALLGKAMFQKKGSGDIRLAPLLLFGSAVMFGITEVMWRTGMLSNAAMYFLPLFTSGCHLAGRYGKKRGQR